MPTITYSPSLEEVRELASQGNLIPVYREVPADLETPVSAYLKVARPPYSFLLESVEGGERLARYSFIGTEPYNVLKSGPGQPQGPIDPLLPIQAEMERHKVVSLPELPRFHGGAVGYVAYDAVRYFEPRVPAPEDDPLGLPESIFLCADTLLVFDHLRHTIKVLSHIRVDDDLEAAYRTATRKIDQLVDRLAQPLAAPPAVTPVASDSIPETASNFTQDDYERSVVRAKEYIYDGDIIQVVLSQRFARPTTAQPFQIYRALRTINPSPYMYYLDLDGFQIIGTSPEMLVRLEDGRVTTHPIAGTRPRGRDSAESEAMEKELRESEKERAEHIMLVDLGRNDIGRVSQPGTVSVPQLMDVERYSHVIHLVSHVVGDIKPELTAYDALRACFPAGTVSGAPKIRAMEIISESEGQMRGPYAGSVGYFSFSGNMDAAITIRTIVMRPDATTGMNTAYVQAGGGIVADSIPTEEYQETWHKASALLRAIDRAEGRG